MILRSHGTREFVRRWAAIGVMILAGGAAACSDPFAPKASLAVLTDTLAVYSMTGTPPAFPAALNTEFRSVVRADADYNFDVAFDLDVQNAVRIIPVKLMGGLTTADRHVGIQKVSGTFEDLTKAPTGTYQTDSVAVVRPGEPFVLEVVSTQCSIYSISTLLYSKVVIDSVRTSEKKIFFRMTHDPNCGFKSFKPGIPKD